jgi:hypothetical protein
VPIKPPFAQDLQSIKVGFFYIWPKIIPKLFLDTAAPAPQPNGNGRQISSPYSQSNPSRKRKEKELVAGAARDLPR